MSEKREKFERLAENRVTDVIKKMRLIGNLSNKSNYDYTEEQVKQIIETLEAELRLLKSRFKDEKVNDSPVFSFKK